MKKYGLIIMLLFFIAGLIDTFTKCENEESICLECYEVHKYQANFYECGNKDHINMFLDKLSNSNGKPGAIDRWICKIK